MKLLKSLLNMVFPEKCPFCGRLLREEEFRLCEKCLTELPYTGGGRKTGGAFFSVCVSPLYYEGQVRRAVHRFKFTGKVNYSDCFGEILADCIRQNIAGEYDLITWVPISLLRLRKRGYSQAKLLAEAAAKELGAAPCISLLEKKRDTRSQFKTRNAAERRANVSGAYSILKTERDRLQGKRILLIDDIVTSGATLSECSRILLTEGAGKVVCATLCKVKKYKK
jgi:ComF family protein